MSHSFRSGFFEGVRRAAYNYMKLIRQRIHWLITPYHGSNRVSRWFRQHIENRPIQELVGIPLAGLAFMAAVIVPQTQAGFESTELYFNTPKTIMNAAVSDSRFQWPLASFGISQDFSGVHPGMDLTDPAGTPIHPVADGTVAYAGTILMGYGKHVIVKHNDTLESLYAHLSQIDVREGQTVTKDTELGAVGATGWATGNHLHLEIHVNGVATNPLEVLPELKAQN